MGSFVFNISKGSWATTWVLPVTGDGLVLALLQDPVEGDDDLADHATLASILGANTEADCTNYERITITASTVVAVNNTANQRRGTIPTPQTFTDIGGAVDNDLAALVVCYSPNISTDTDSDFVPVSCHSLLTADVPYSTSGRSLVLNLDPTSLVRARG